MRTLDDLREWVESAPRGTLIPVERLLEALEDLEPGSPSAPELVPPDTPWRVLFWTIDAETRIGRDELLEAIGKPKSWLYRHTGPKSEDRIPHRRLDGELVFVVGEVRRWLREREEIVLAGPLEGSDPRIGVVK